MTLSKKTIIQIANISLFLWAFISPLSDLPKIEIFNTPTRLGYIFLIPFLLELLFSLKQTSQGLLEKFKFTSILIALLIGYNLVNLALIDAINGRSFGFIIWLSINSIIFLACLYNSSRISFIIKGYLCGQVLNSIYLILSVLLYPSFFYMKPIEPYFFNEMIRGIGLSGEPSYFAVSIIPLIAYLGLIKNKSLLNYATLALFTTAGFLSYSRLFLLGFLVIGLFCLFRKLKTQLKVTPLFGIAILAFIISYQVNPRYYSFLSNEDRVTAKVNWDKSNYPEKLRKLNTDTGIVFIDRGWNSQRVISMMRSYELFKDHSVSGVGLGNSHESLNKRFLGTAPEHYYVEGCSNLYIEILLEQGLIGALLLLLFLYFYIREGSLLNKDFVKLFPITLLLVVVMQFSQTFLIPAVLVFLLLPLFSDNLFDRHKN